MAKPDSEHFYQLPPLHSEALANLPPGHALSLLLLEYVPTGQGVIFMVKYIHRELIYRSPGQKDAVAHGTAKLQDSSQFRDVRILFSRPHETATLRGLEFEGQVKLA